MDGRVVTAATLGSERCTTTHFAIGSRRPSVCWIWSANTRLIGWVWGGVCWGVLLSGLR